MSENGHTMTTSNILLLDEGIRLRVLQQLAEQGNGVCSRVFGASALTITVDDVIDTDLLTDRYTFVDVLISSQPQDTAMLRDEGHPIGATIRRALQSAMPMNTFIRRVTVLEAEDRTDGAETDEVPILTTVGTATNQGPQSTIDSLLIWEHLRFRSKTEIRIAQALDRAGALYFPNCRARLGSPTNRLNKEPDFVVCHAGAWGILEVDGEPYHRNHEQDETRDALFIAAGVSFIRRYNASECYERPDEIVATFLADLTTEQYGVHEPRSSIVRSQD